MMPTLRLAIIRALFLRLPLQCCCTADAADESSAGQRITHAHAQFKCIDSRTLFFLRLWPRQLFTVISCTRWAPQPPAAAPDDRPQSSLAISLRAEERQSSLA